MQPAIRIVGDRHTGGTRLEIRTGSGLGEISRDPAEALKHPDHYRDGRNFQKPGIKHLLTFSR